MGDVPYGATALSDKYSDAELHAALLVVFKRGNFFADAWEALMTMPQRRGLSSTSFRAFALSKKVEEVMAMEMSKGSKEKGYDLEGKVASSSRVYVLSELGYDTAYFNPDAYDNLLRVMEKDRDISGIIIDGALTRLDRPEYLNDELSYWTRSEDECKKETESVPNKRQYKDMMEKQLKILEERIVEMKQRVPHAKKVVLYIDSDDMQYTISAMVNEMLLRGQKEMQDSMDSLKTKKNGLKKEYAAALKERDKKHDGDTASDIGERIRSYESKLADFDERIKNKSDEQKLYREKKVRPAHQYFTARFLKKVYGQYEELAKKLDITIATRPTIMDFDGMILDYAHSRHGTWAVLKRRQESMLASTHGKPTVADVIVESGHFGIGYKQLQKKKDTADESNFKNQSSYDPNIGRDHVTLVSVLPFEDQERIGRFVKGQEPIRLSGGKPINTRKHAAIDRYNNDGVAGLTVITKDKDGIIGTEWIQYGNFADGTVLAQPDEYSIICASADEHIGSPEENLIARDGWFGLYRMLAQGTLFRGKGAFARGFINGGDAAEANSKKWCHRYHEKRNPQDIMRENLKLLSDFKPGNIEDIVALATKMTNDARGGSVESMSVILERVADYYDSFLRETLQKSRLKWAHVSVTGNHADDILKDVGMRESDFFVQRAKARGIGVYEVGKPDYYLADPKKDARIFIGSYSNARILNVDDYGIDTDGNVLFGPISLLVQHDPKGSGVSGLVGAGKSAGADLALGAHTHDNWMKLYRTSENRWSVAYKLATLQTVSPTEKYYANSVPRTSAAHMIVMPMQGDFSEKAIPTGHLAEIGRRVLRDNVGYDFEKVLKEGK